MQGYLRENIALICSIIHHVFFEYSGTVFPLIPLYDDIVRIGLLYMYKRNCIIYIYIVSLIISTSA